MSIDLTEFCGAVLNKRLKAVLQQHCRYKFQRYYHIVDSQIVHAMIHEETYGVNATRVREIQDEKVPKRMTRIGLRVNITLLIG